MDKLANYGSDDDYEDSPKTRKTGTENENYGRRSEREQAEADANYEEVHMDLSEDSASSGSSRSATPKRENRAPPRRDDDPKWRNRGGDERRDPKDDGRRESKDENRRDSKDSRRDSGRVGKERYRNREEKHKDRHRDERNRDLRDSRDKYRKSKRSPSRERRSRSPRRPDHRNRRSSSRDRDGRTNYARKYDRYPAKASFEKQDTQKPPAEEQKLKQDGDGNRFFMPGVSGRFRDQIERRKLLWQKKDKDVEKPEAAPSTSTGKVWQATTFAQDTDGKVASKFKRLMGIREPGDGQKPVGDSLKKQEEMFSSMEQQYEVARTATHTMRGVGLGFGSFQR